MQSMEDVVGFLLKATSGSGSSVAPRPLDDLVRGAGDFLRELRKFPAGDLENAIQHMDARRHPSAFAILLAAKACHSQSSVDSLLQQVRGLVEQQTHKGKLASQLDGQVVGLMMRQLLERLLRDRTAHLGVELFYHVLRLLQDNPHQLTEIHPLFLQLCLEGNNLKSVLEVLKTDIFDISAQKIGDVQNCVAYFYYGAVVLSKHNFFISALRSIQTIFIMPGAATAMNPMVTESYKKYLLLIILAKHRATGLPKTVAGYLENQMKKAVAPYQAFHDAFLADGFDMQALQNLATQHAALFHQEGNTGLIQQCLKRYRVKELMKHAEVFENMEMSMLMQKLQITEAVVLESLLLDMYSYSDFIGRIDMGRNTVVFGKKIPVISSQQAFDALQSSLANMQSAMDAAWRVEEELLLNSDLSRSGQEGHSSDGDPVEIDQFMPSSISAVSSAPGISSGSGSTGSRASSRLTVQLSPDSWEMQANAPPFLLNAADIFALPPLPGALSPFASPSGSPPLTPAGGSPVSPPGADVG